MLRHRPRRRLRRIYNAGLRWRHPPQQFPEQGIMRAAQHEHVGVTEPIGKSLAEINSSHLLGDRMLKPPLLDQGNQQRTSLLDHLKPAGLERLAISMTADRRLGSDHNHFFISTGPGGSLSPGPYHPDNRYMRGQDNAV